MAGNKMSRAVKYKYDEMLWEKERLLYRQRQATSITGTGLRIKKDLVLLGTLLKNLFLLQIYVLLLIAMYVSLWNKVASQRIDIQ